jgi:putative intracellular protease/amidase
MDSKLDGLRVAILATDGFEQSELLEPRKALDSAGATTEVISPKGTEIKGWNHGAREELAEPTTDPAGMKGFRRRQG